MSYQCACWKCNTIFSSAIPVSNLCSMCYSYEQSRKDREADRDAREKISSYSRGSSYDHSTASDNNIFSVCLTGSVFSAITWFIGLSANIGILEALGTWGMRIFLLPLYAMGMAVAVFSGVVTGDYSAMADLTHMYWVSVKK